MSTQPDHNPQDDVPEILSDPSSPDDIVRDQTPYPDSDGLELESEDEKDED